METLDRSGVPVRLPPRFRLGGASELHTRQVSAALRGIFVPLANGDQGAILNACSICVLAAR